VIAQIKRGLSELETYKFAKKKTTGGTYWKIGKNCLKLGIWLLLGASAHIGMWKRSSEQTQLDGSQHFLDMVRLPPIDSRATPQKMAMHCGYHRGGVAGLFVAGLSFLLFLLPSLR